MQSGNAWGDSGLGCRVQGSGVRVGHNMRTHTPINPHGKTTSTSFGSHFPLQTSGFRGSGKVNLRSENRRFGLSVRVGGHSHTICTATQLVNLRTMQGRGATEGLEHLRTPAQDSTSIRECIEIKLFWTPIRS